MGMCPCPCGGLRPARPALLAVFLGFLLVLCLVLGPTSARLQSHSILHPGRLRLCKGQGRDKCKKGYKEINETGGKHTVIPQPVTKVYARNRQLVKVPTAGGSGEQKGQEGIFDIAVAP